MSLSRRFRASIFASVVGLLAVTALCWIPAASAGPYGIYWTPTSVQTFLDRVPGPIFNASGTVPTESMYPIIQLAVGKGYQPAAGSTMLVDYVRAWQE